MHVGNLTLYSMLPSMSTSGGNDPWWLTQGDTSSGLEGTWKAAMVCVFYKESNGTGWVVQVVMVRFDKGRVASAVFI